MPVMMPCTGDDDCPYCQRSSSDVRDFIVGIIFIAAMILICLIYGGSALQ